MGWIFIARRNAHHDALEAFLVSESQSGTARLVAISRFFVANWRETLESLISTTSFTLSAKEECSPCDR